MPRYALLDVLRGVAALTVALGHGMIPMPPELSSKTGVLLSNVLRLSTNGSAAVLLFFVISGFCIHLPQTRKPLQLRSFLAQRLTRLGLPLLAASVLAYSLGFRWFDFHEARFAFGTTVVWSLFCEVTYYILYGVIQSTALRSRWVVIFLVSLPVAVGTAMSLKGNLEFATAGFIPATLMGWPIWLAGVLIAEKVSVPQKGRRIRTDILLWLVVLGGAPLATVLKFSVGISYPLTLIPWALVAAYWIFRNLSIPVPHWLTLLGPSSYSLYLLHQPATGFLKQHIELTPWMLSLVVFGIVMAISFGFYAAIERPSHALARAFGRKLRKDSPEILPRS